LDLLDITANSGHLGPQHHNHYTTKPANPTVIQNLHILPNISLQLS